MTAKVTSCHLVLKPTPKNWISDSAYLIQSNFFHFRLLWKWFSGTLKVKLDFFSNFSFNLTTWPVYFPKRFPKFLLTSRITLFLFLLPQLTHLAATWNKISKFQICLTLCVKREEGERKEGRQVGDNHFLPRQQRHRHEHAELCSFGKSHFGPGPSSGGGASLYSMCWLNNIWAPTRYLLGTENSTIKDSFLP